LSRCVEESGAPADTQSVIRSARAQASLEFALVIPLFLLLVVGIFDVARAYVAYTVVASCAREAARSGAVHYPDTNPDWKAQARQACLNLAVGVDRAALNITMSQDPTLPSYVRADVTYLFHSLTPLVGTLVGDPITLKASTVVLAG
jgi:Flp pilus assembly protein TadG